MWADIPLVPDFRSSTGLFNTLRNDNKLKASGKHLFDASVYQTDSSTAGFHDMVRTLSKLVRDAIPTEFHEMLATLGGEGRLMRLYTQNVDGIDTSLEPLKTSVPLAPKGPWPRTIQLHGSLEIMVCSKCNALFPFQAALFDGPNPPPCTACITNDEVRTTHAGKRSHGIGKLRPRMVLYNEHNPDEEAIGTVVTADLRSRPDAVIVVGTSMEIPGVKRIVREMCGVVRGRRDGLAVWINRGPPPIGKEFEDCWDLVVKGDCDKVAGLADMRRWDDVCDPVSILVTESEAKRAKEKEGEMKVIVKSPCKKKAEAGLMTPAPSPKLGPTKVPVKLLLNAPKSLGSDNDKKPKPKSTSRFSRPAKAKTATSKSTKPSKAKSTTKPTPTLSTAFKVTKRTRSPPAAKKAPPQTREDPRPFDPIPPHSARSNSTVPSPPHQSVALNLDQIKAEKTGVFAEIPGNDAAEARRGSGGRLSEMRDTIVSPTGRVSPEMRSLLN